jgi:hypothetical protein
LLFRCIHRLIYAAVLFRVVVTLCRVAGVLTSKEEELALTDALQRVQGEKESVIDSGKEQKESALVADSREELEQARVLCEDPELSPPLVLLR